MTFSSFSSMSIAVSAVVKPSKSLKILSAVLSFGVLAIACFAVFEYPDIPVWLSSVVAGVVFAGTYQAAMSLLRPGKSLHIDISENGQIKVEEDKAIDTAARQNCLAIAKKESDVVKLMPDSTLWSFLLVLRLRAVDKSVRSVVVLPDCMGAEKFRALSVACRWIAAHNENEREIL